MSEVRGLGTVKTRAPQQEVTPPDRCVNGQEQRWGKAGGKGMPKSGAGEEKGLRVCSSFRYVPSGRSDSRHCHSHIIAAVEV